MRTNLTRDFYIPNGATKVAAKESDAVVYFYTSSNGKPAAVGFSGKAAKPRLQYYFGSEERRTKVVTKFFADTKSIADAKVKRREERKQHSLELGSILYSSWGYDQTNIDFYQVVGFAGKTLVKLRKVQSALADNQSSGGFYNKVVPVKDAFNGSEFRKKIDGDRVSLNSYSSAYLWDGTPKSETAAGYGH